MGKKRKEDQRANKEERKRKNDRYLRKRKRKRRHTRKGKCEESLGRITKEKEEAIIDEEDKEREK